VTEAHLGRDHPRVLVVDDEPAICQALGQVLRRAGFDPVLAPGAIEAEMLLDDSIDAMVIDLRVPYMRGDVFFHIATARFPKLRSRTLIMSGDISPEAERLVSLTGCQCLWKPFPNAELVSALRSFFSESGNAVGAG
jgi:two-component system response regulator VicR